MDLKSIYSDLQTQLKPYCSKMELVIFSDPVNDMPAYLKILISGDSSIEEKLKELGFEKLDEHYFIKSSNELAILIGVTTKESWGAAHINITCCPEFYAKLVSHAKHRGYELTYLGLTKGGVKYPSNYEAFIFRELGLYIPNLTLRNFGCDLSLKLPTTKLCDVTSSDGTKIYSLFKDGDQISCTCDGFMYRNTCSHITEDYIREHRLPTKEIPMKNTSELLTAINELVILLITRFKDGIDLKDFPAIWEKLTTDEDFKGLMRVAYEGIENVPEEVKNMATEEALQMTILQLQYIPKIMGVLKK